jgi:DNA-binding MarR family transcriptional regulator
MELREYLAIRRAYNVVRQARPAAERMTFAEFAILCHLEMDKSPQTTSKIASYQHALRPTMTHRVGHLSELGLIERAQGEVDRRNVVCSITEDGSLHARRTCGDICEVLHEGPVLSRTMSQRVMAYVRAMGTLSLPSGDLALLAIARHGEDGASIGSVVEELGMLQPTISMSISTLDRQGLVERKPGARSVRRGSTVLLTEKGAARSEELLDQISGIVIRRTH